MIRIKNVILNETAMKYLYQVDEDTIKVVLENENVNINATLNDIECNYCENATTIKVNEELKKENEYLKHFNKTLMNHNGDAARYIQDYCISEKTGRISDAHILKIYKLLSGGGEPRRVKEEE